MNYLSELLNQGFEVSKNATCQVYADQLAFSGVAIASIWIGRKVALRIQSIPNQGLENSPWALVRTGYNLYKYLSPEKSTRRRFTTVIFIEHGLLALQISIGHLFFTSAAPADVSFRRKMTAALLEAAIIATMLDMIRKVLSWFFISPIKEMMAPADRQS